MKILFVTATWPSYGGGETFLRTLIEFLEKEHGHECIIATARISDSTAQSTKTVKIQPCNNSLSEFFGRRVYNEFDRLFKCEKPDICHINTLSGFGTAPLRAAAKNKIPTLLTWNDYYPVCGNAHLFYNSRECSGSSSLKCFLCEFVSADPALKKNVPRSFLCGFRNLLRLRYKKYLTDIKAIVYPSESARKTAQKFGAPSHSAHVIKYPYKPLETKIDATKRVGFATGGRLVRYKGFSDAIIACNELKQPLVVFGSGPYEKELRAVAGPTIQFVGHCSTAQIYAYLRNAKAYIAPSLWPETGAPTFAIMDAYATQTPVVASRIGGQSEGVVEGETGLLFEAGDREELKQKLNLVLEGWQSSVDSIDTIVAQNDAQQSIGKYSALYEKLHS